MIIPKKRGAPSSTPKEAPQANSSSKPIIEEKKPKGKGKGQKELKNAGGLAMSSTTNSLNVKVYEAQVDGGFVALRQRIAAIDPKEYQVMAIVHDKDVKTDPDDIFVEAFKKAHVHILAKKPGSKSKDRAKVSTILNVLGITFTADEEGINLWSNRGVESIRDMSNATMYLTHETDAALDSGKEVYPRSDIISNLTPEEIDLFREGYTRLSSMKRKLTPEEQLQYAEEAYKAGYELKNKEDWLNSLPFSVFKSSLCKALEKKFDYGAKTKADEVRDLVRLAVFIEGAPGIGKTYAAYHAFDNKNYKRLSIDAGGGSGKFDNLTSSHDVIVADDTTIENALGMTDNKISQPYRRGSNNPFWTGPYIIITSNDNVDKWGRKCGLDDDALAALKTRLYICKVATRKDGTMYLGLKEYSKRGDPASDAKRMTMFDEFADAFNKLINEYRLMRKAEVERSILSRHMYEEDVEEYAWFGSRPSDDAKQIPGQAMLPSVDAALPFGIPGDWKRKKSS